MDARLLVSSKFMVSETFGLGDVPKEPLVTIADVKIEEQNGDGDKQEKWGLLFFREPWAKPLKVNRTHQRALIQMFGNETDGWKGKRIGIYAMAGTFFGKRQTAVRIKGSPDIKAPISFQVKKFGGGKDTYDLVPMGLKTETPYERMWRTWRAAGHSSEPDFKALIKTATGKTTPKQLDDADVARFEAALVAQSAPPPMTEEEQREIAAREAEPGSGG